MQVWSTMLFVNSLQSCNAGPKNENQQPKICNSWRFIGHGPQVPTLLKKTYAIRNQNCTIQQHERKFEGVALCISSGEVVYGSLFYFCTWRVHSTFIWFFVDSFMPILLQILTILFWPGYWNSSRWNTLVAYLVSCCNSWKCFSLYISILWNGEFQWYKIPHTAYALQSGGNLHV